MLFVAKVSQTSPEETNLVNTGKCMLYSLDVVLCCKRKLKVKPRMRLLFTFVIALAFQILFCSSGNAIIADRFGGHFKTLTGKRNTLDVYESTGALSEVKCSLHCLRNDSCNSYNYNRYLSTCELSRSLDVADRMNTGEGIIDSVDVQDWKAGYRQLDGNFCSVTLPPMKNPCSSAPCQNEAISCEPKKCNRDFQCTCSTGYSGKRCEIADCPDGFTLRFNSSCYKFVNESKTWLDAEGYCQTLDASAHLVGIETEEEDIFLTESTNAIIWTGGNDRDNEGDWRWVGTSEPVPGRGWDDDEPNGNLYFTEEDCIVKFTPHYKWHDVQCGSTLQFVCEVKV